MVSSVYGGGWLRGSSDERGARALTDGHVITARKSMLLDLRLPHTFTLLDAGQTDVDYGFIKKKKKVVDM